MHILILCPCSSFMTHSILGSFFFSSCQVFWIQPLLIGGGMWCLVLEMGQPDFGIVGAQPAWESLQTVVLLSMEWLWVLLTTP